MSGKALIWGAMWKVSEREGFDLGAMWKVSGREGFDLGGDVEGE